MRSKRMLARALGVESSVCGEVEELNEAPGFVVDIHLRAGDRNRCPECQEVCPGYDQANRRRRWRTHPLGLGMTYVEAVVPRIRCPAHGVRVAHVPWARPGARFTTSFEDRVAWQTVRMDKSTLSALNAIAWRTVGAIIARVGDTMKALAPPLENVTRIGIDEVSYRKGHRYLTIVVDHDTGRLLWAHAGHGQSTLRKFFKMLGRRRCNEITLVSADAAAWISTVVQEACPNAELCMDPFHVVAWATQALDHVRRATWNKLRKRGQTSRATAMKGTRWALLKNPENLTRGQRSALAQLKADNRDLYAAYLLKEQLRAVFQNRDWQGAFMLQEWIRMATGSRLPAFKRVAQSVEKHRDAITAALMNRLSNARIEGVNTKLKLLTRQAYGFHSHKPLIALAMMKLGGLCPPLPRLS